MKTLRSTLFSSKPPNIDLGNGCVEAWFNHELTPKVQKVTLPGPPTNILFRTHHITRLIRNASHAQPSLYLVGPIPAVWLSGHLIKIEVRAMLRCQPAAISISVPAFGSGKSLTAPRPSRNTNIV